MIVTVLLFGVFRQIVGTDRLSVEMGEGAVLADLLHILRERYGTAFEVALAETRGLRILVEGREFRFAGGYEAPLQDGCTVVFLPPVAGG
ncbi:MoaD/ThiS family protein [Coprothermobacteraceae bacterium]|nr:MoaD/ThiS family protein [Coprothermobacteraceae bacterium]